MSVPMWGFIPLNEYRKPAEPTPEAVRSGLLDLWRRLRRTGASTQGRPEEAGDELDSLPERILNWVAPPPEWGQLGRERLTEALKTWLALEDEEAGQRVFVTAPHSGASEMVRSFAGTRGFRLIRPPSHEQILKGKDWFQEYREDRNARFVIAGLERCFLRHQDGFTSLRRLLDWLWQDRPACLITCDSWAWAYLGRALELDRVYSNPLTMAPFDSEALSGLLSGLSNFPREGCFVFRQQGDGNPVFPAHDALATGPEGGDGKKPEVSDFVVRLAARSRGNPGVAWAIWRKSLEISSEEDVAEEAQKIAESDACHTISVRSWGKLELPGLPGESGVAEAFVLHAVLIHGGLPFRLLCELLPLPSTEVWKTLMNLKAAEFVSEEREGWRIRAVGYAEARAFLFREGFLVDDL